MEDNIENAGEPNVQSLNETSDDIRSTNSQSSINTITQGITSAHLAASIAGEKKFSK